MYQPLVKSSTTPNQISFFTIICYNTILVIAPMKNIFSKIKNWYISLPDKKRHIELITAVLSVPMMTTVILVNLNNIQAQKNKTNSTASITPIQVIVDSSQTSSPSATTNATISPLPTKPECLKDIGPIQILSPQEGEIITTDNVCINISTDSKYCPIIWSYRLGTDNWSDFNNNDICLYNLTPGKKQLQLKIKSTSVDKIITLGRIFTYQTQITPTITPTITITPTLTPTPTP